MSRILARFKRSPSTSSTDDQPVSPQQTSISTPSIEDDQLISPSSSPYHTLPRSSPVRVREGSTASTGAGSHFIEEFDITPDQSSTSFGASPSHLHPNSPISPSKRRDLSTSSSPSRYQHDPDGLTSTPGKKRALGTPKLVLTEEGSNSPRSFGSSPGKDLDSSPRGSPVKTRGLGLGLGVSAYEAAPGDFEDQETPRVDEFGEQQKPPNNRTSSGKSKLSVNSVSSTTTDRHSLLSPSSVSGIPDSRNRTKPRSGSIIDRLKGGRSSPTPQTVSVHKTNDRLDVGSSSERHRGKMANSSEKKGSRRLSINSARSAKARSIAAAVNGKGGHNVTGQEDEGISRHQQTRSLHSAVNGDRDDGSMRDDDSGLLDYDDEEDEDESGSDFDDLPVTGFAVASNRRNLDFHSMFPAVDEGDYLIEDYGCALSKDILVQGRLYVSENHICFHANIFGWVTDLVIPFSQIRLIEKRMTALVIPNAIGISTGREKYTFASFISRDTTYDVIMNIWRLCNPNAVMSTASFNYPSRPTSPINSDIGDDNTAKNVADEGQDGKPGHEPTQCDCGRDGKHYAETALETVLSSTPEKIYNLMFASEWCKRFMSEDQKLKDIELSDWRPMESNEKLLTRSMTYIKPLNGSIGPRQTKCHIVDEQEHFELDKYICLVTTTRTPDVPSGGVFSVKTRTCFMWAGGNATKLIVTTTVEWTGKSWVRGIIEKSAIDGQKTFHDDLVKGMKKYIKEHPTEFGVPEDQTDSPLINTSDGQLPPKGEDGKSQTEAEAYAAAQTRRRQHDEDLGYLQSGLDAVYSGLKSIGSGITAIFESVSDLMKDVPLSKETILGIVILLLVITNIWTLAFTGSDPKKAEVRKMRRINRENDLTEAVRLLIENTQQQQVVKEAQPHDEAQDLVRLLNDVESRAAKLRSAIMAMADDPN